MTQANRTETRDERAARTRATENSSDLYQTSGSSPGHERTSGAVRNFLNTQTIPAATDPTNRDERNTQARASDSAPEIISCRIGTKTRYYSVEHLGKLNYAERCDLAAGLMKRFDSLTKSLAEVNADIILVQKACFADEAAA